VQANNNLAPPSDFNSPFGKAALDGILLKEPRFRFRHKEGRDSLMNNVSAKAKFVLGGVVIVAALGWLGFVGFEESKAYYITVDEYAALTEPREGRVFKLAGDVVAGSIDRSKPQMEFIIASNNKEILVRYVGKDIIPDTFRDGSTALVEGSAAPDGTFHARHIEAKCASKYEAEYDKRTTS